MNIAKTKKEKKGYERPKENVQNEPDYLTSTTFMGKRMTT